LMDAMFFIASVLGFPLETGMRREQGSRYQHPVALALALLPPLVFFAGSAASSRFGINHGLIGMGWIYLASVILFWIHVVHVVRVMIHPEKEELSHEDGKPLPIWKLLPRGNSWGTVRFVYEPGSVLVLAFVLTGLRILTPVAGAYLALIAFAMLIKVTFLWYFTWEWLRDILDNIGLTRRMAKDSGRSGQESVHGALERARARMIRTPAMVPQAAVNMVRRQAEETLPAELRDLLSAPEPIAETSTQSTLEEDALRDLLSDAQTAEACASRNGNE